MSEDKQPLEQAVPVEKEMTDQRKKSIGSLCSRDVSVRF